MRKRTNKKRVARSNINKTSKTRKGKRGKKRNSKLYKIFKLIFSSIYIKLVSLKLLGPSSNKLRNIGILVASVIVIYIVTRRNAYEIIVGNEPVATISMKSGATQEDFKNTAVAMLASEKGTNVLVNEDVEFRPVNSLRRNMNTVEQALRSASNAFTYKVEAGTFVVNGNEVVTVSSVREANEIYNELIAPFTTQEATVIDSGFIQDVKVVPRFVEYEEVSSKDAALTTLNATTKEIQVYEVRSGDTLWGIANSMGMSLDELLEYNPHITTNTVLSIGDQLSLYVAVPRLTVFVQEELTITQTVPYTTETTYNDNEPFSYSRVIQRGINGEAKSTYHIMKINGIETERTHIQTEVTIQPVIEIIDVGTKIE